MTWSSAPATKRSWFRAVTPGKLSSRAKKSSFDKQTPAESLPTWVCKERQFCAGQCAPGTFRRRATDLPSASGRGDRVRMRSRQYVEPGGQVAPASLSAKAGQPDDHGAPAHPHLKRSPTFHEIDARQPHASMKPQLNSNHAHHDGCRYRPPPASRWFRRAGRRRDGRQSPARRRQSRACPSGCAGTRWGHAHWNAGQARR